MEIVSYVGYNNSKTDNVTDILANQLENLKKIFKSKASHKSNSRFLNIPEEYEVYLFIFDSFFTKVHYEYTKPNIQTIFHLKNNNYCVLGTNFLIIWDLAGDVPVTVNGYRFKDCYFKNGCVINSQIFMSGINCFYIFTFNGK